jgi:hypothetical protein
VEDADEEEEEKEKPENVGCDAAAARSEAEMVEAGAVDAVSEDGVRICDEKAGGIERNRKINQAIVATPVEMSRSSVRV